MAGGKESPRQRMINMMYLVLTAMLALQVSNAILQKFVLLDNSLTQANSAANVSNNQTLKQMDESITKNGNKPVDRQYYTQGVNVRKETENITSYLESLKTRIVMEAGGGINKETGAIENLAEEDKVTSIFVTNKEGDKMKKKIEDYVAYLQKVVAKDYTYNSLTLDGDKDPAMKSADAMTRGKSFVNLNFTTTPVPAAMASISQKISEIRRYENEALKVLASKVGLAEIKFDKIFAVVVPDSRTVVAGQTYKSEIMIGAFSSTITPNISVNGTGLSVKDGKGTYEVRTQGGQFDANGQLKRKYTATVSFRGPDGTLKSENKDEEYTVLKPSVQVLSQSMPALYFKCANKIQVASPGLGNLFKPTFSGSGGEFLPGGGGKVTIIPTGNKVNLDVKNDGITLESFPFAVRLIPKPSIAAFVNGSKVSSEMTKKGLKANTVRMINVQAIADESFKNTNPDDAAFRVSNFSVFLGSGIRGKGKLENLSGNANINSLAQQAEAGDRYIIQINKVERRNFQGGIEEVNVGDISFSIPLF
jgi:gliding motility-associated protein GldM